MTAGSLALPVSTLGRIRAMSRLLATLAVLVLLPLQASWSVAAAYCQHEADAQACGFGHHVHEHRAGLDVDPDADADGVADAGSPSSSTSLASGLGTDADCEDCHLCIKFLVRTTEVAATGSPPDGDDGTPRSLNQRDPDRVERPKWLLA